MTIQEKAAVLLGVSYAENTAVLDILAEMVANEVEAYCNVDDIPAGQENTMVQMVCHKFNARYGAGLSGASYSGIREDYRDRYTADIFASLNSYRRVKCL